MRETFKRYEIEAQPEQKKDMKLFYSNYLKIFYVWKVYLYLYYSISIESIRMRRKSSIKYGI